MHPTTVIELIFLFGATVFICLFALLFPNKIRKIIWVVSGLVLIIGVGFYVIRPFIVEHQTTETLKELNNYLEDKYPKDSWGVTDTDEHEIQSNVILHVIFESEQNIVYEYVVDDTTIKQIGMWTISGDSVYDRGITPRHKESHAN